MPPSAKLTTLWVSTARRVLEGVVAEVIPATASPVGLAPVLRLLARQIIGEPKAPQVEALLCEAWKLDPADYSGRAKLGRRLPDHRLPTPRRLVVAMRAAAVGVLAKDVPLYSIAPLVNMSHTSHLYAMFRSLEAGFGRLTKPRDVANFLRTAALPTSGFGRFVVPLLPAQGDARWQIPLRPQRTDSTCRRCGQPVIVWQHGNDRRPRNADGTIHSH